MILLIVYSAVSFQPSYLWALGFEVKFTVIWICLFHMSFSKDAILIHWSSVGYKYFYGVVNSYNEFQSVRRKQVSMLSVIRAQSKWEELKINYITKNKTEGKWEQVRTTRGSSYSKILSHIHATVT